ncbi:DUF5317 domain-containing protein [Demequina lutea]|uniref:Uncharacterized protein n=1 Tax=Demequina lutea TaxID=431489 RepID=A0A7Y9ZAM5_9MICO|nr:DUF5317 domain-containing protein [Demequina lutea]NYI41676.1 hypothetical protein [Demequina lutea]
MLVVVLCTVGIISPLLAGRWPAGLLLHKWRLPVLIWAALAFQVVAVEVAMPHALAATVHVLTYAVAFAFLWLNRRVGGVLIVAAGAITNGVVIALNGGTLPASASAVKAAGLDGDIAFANSAVLDHPVLPWLGDAFAWPTPLPLANTFSVGDVLIVVGVFVAAWVGSRRFGAPPSASVSEPVSEPVSAPDN